MPEISRFLGIVIRMYFADHEPAHFHAAYGEFEGQVRISPVGLLGGSLPPRVLSLVVEWASLHQEALLENWGRLRCREAPLPIPPLE
jgi:hypothetical protein